VNRCFNAAVLTLPTGLTMSAVYVLSGTLTGTENVSSSIDGPAVFEGQTRTQLTITSTQSVDTGGSTLDTASVIKDYRQAVAGVVTDYGTLTTSTTTQGGTPVASAASKLVYTPPITEVTYQLALGQSVTQSATSVVTITAPTPAPPPATSTTTTTTKYAADETIVVRGKSYDTCRYEITDSSATGVTTNWLLVGKGVSVKIQTTDGSTTPLLLELSSGTYNGAPL
jgi:hypothetical protein